MAATLLAAIRSMAQKSADKLFQYREPAFFAVFGIGGGYFIGAPILKRLTGLHQLEILQAEEFKTDAKLKTMRKDFYKERMGYIEEIYALRRRLAALEKGKNSRDAGGVGHPGS